jgi:hypothetical protein
VKIEVKGLDHMDATVERWLRKAEQQTQKRLRNTSLHAIQWISRHAPQYSGDFVANLKVAVNRIDPSFEVGAVIDHMRKDRTGASVPFHQGSSPAILYAISEAVSPIAHTKFGDFIAISSSATHGKPYAWKVENNAILFRPENVEGGRVFGRFLDSLRSLPV